MNSAKSRICVALAFAVALGVSACDRKASTKARTALAPDASAQVIGKEPAPPTGDPPGTTPVASNTTTVSKDEEINKKPQEGDNHSYSTLAPYPKQKGDQPGTDARTTK